MPSLGRGSNRAGLQFFPEYTDHSSKHIVEVLQTASSLVRDEAWSVLTASDSCFALSRYPASRFRNASDGGWLSFTRARCLLADASARRSTSAGYVGGVSLAQAARFDGRKLTKLFGSSEPIHRPAHDPAQWELRDRLLIGEFIRRHHARLAHEIAVNGVPGPTNTPIRLKDVPSDLAGLAGLIARSHGVRLRDCLEHLSATDPREYKGVHAVFLMALLRIADYLQMHQERAPSQLPASEETA